MSLNVEDLRLRAQSFRDRADAAVDDREREVCLGLARDYEAYLSSLNPRPASPGTPPSGSALADGSRRFAAETAAPGSRPTLGDTRRRLRQKGQD